MYQHFCFLSSNVLTTRIQEEIAPILQEELQKAMSNVLPE